MVDAPAVELGCELDGTGRVLYYAKDIWPRFVSCVLVVRDELIAEHPPYRSIGGNEPPPSGGSVGPPGDCADGGGGITFAGGPSADE